MNKILKYTIGVLIILALVLWIVHIFSLSLAQAKACSEYNPTYSSDRKDACIDSRNNHHTAVFNCTGTILMHCDAVSVSSTSWEFNNES